MGQVILGSTGPFGPTIWTCLLVPLFLGGPLVLAAIYVRYLLHDEPMPAWLLALVVLGAAACVYALLPLHIPWRMGAFWWTWWGVANAAVLLLPLVLLREAQKRGWLYALRQWWRRQRPQL